MRYGNLKGGGQSWFRGAKGGPKRRTIRRGPTRRKIPRYSIGRKRFA